MGQPAVKHAQLIQARERGLIYIIWFTRPELPWCIVSGATCSNLIGGLCFDHWFSPPPQRGHWHRGKLHREAVRGPMSVATWAECLDGYAPTIPPKVSPSSKKFLKWWRKPTLQNGRCFHGIEACVGPHSSKNISISSFRRPSFPSIWQIISWHPDQAALQELTFFTTWYTCHTFGWGMIHSSPQWKGNIWCLPPMQAGRKLQAGHIS